jgi:hypothetical protein
MHEIEVTAADHVIRWFTSGGICLAKASGDYLGVGTWENGKIIEKCMAKELSPEAKEALEWQLNAEFERGKSCLP